MSKELLYSKFLNDPALVAYYRLEDINDNKGSRTLTNYGSVSFNAAKFNNGADYGSDNSSKMLYRQDDNYNFNYGLNNNITLSGWFKIQTEPTTGQAQSFFCFQLDQYHNASYQRYFYRLYYYNDNGTKKIWTSNNSGGSYAVTLGTSEWHHIAMTTDASGNQKIYLDGKLIISGVTTDQTTSNSDVRTILSLGAMSYNRIENPSIDSYSKMYQDDTMIFSRVLSDNEIFELVFDLDRKYKKGSLGLYLPA